MAGKLLHIFRASLIFYFLSMLHNGTGYKFESIPSVKSKKGAQKYLLQYGYVQTSDFSGTDLPPAKLSKSIKVFQEFANLRTTGVLDPPTIRQMELPRCGQSDLIIKKRRVKRWQHQGSYWKKGHLTWRYDRRAETRDLPRYTVIRVLENAFSLWSKRTNLEFSQTNGNDPDIWVKFVSQGHGDPYSFDGKGGTLAHAFYPGQNRGLDGDVHFDDAEKFTVESKEGRNLMWVATHEIGHSLGIAHSRVKGAVMYPWYTPFKQGFDLTYDDIIAIQTLYGGRRPVTATTTTTTTPAPPTGTCRDERGSICISWAAGGYCVVDEYVAFMRESCCKSCTERVHKVVTKATTTTTRATTTTTTTRRSPIQPSMKACPGDHIVAAWRISKYNTYGLLTSGSDLYMVGNNGRIMYSGIDFLKYLPKNNFTKPISAAVTTRLGGSRTKYTILFAGGEYGIYKDFTTRVSGPHSIYDGRGPLRLTFPTWITEVTAAMKWIRNRRVYIFVRDIDNRGWYYRFNADSLTVDRGYPKLSHLGFGGLPFGGPDAAVSYNGKTYFIAGDKVSKLNDTSAAILSGYPEKIGGDLIHCRRPGELKVGTPHLKLPSLIARLFRRIKQKGTATQSEHAPSIYELDLL